MDGMLGIKAAHVIDCKLLKREEVTHARHNIMGTQSVSAIIAK